MVHARAQKRIVIALASTFVGLLVVGYYIPHTFSALLTSLVLAYLLNPVLNCLERRGFDRLTALVLLYSLGALATLLASFVIIPYLGHQFDSLTKALPGYLKSLLQLLERWQGKLGAARYGEEGAWFLAQAQEAAAAITGKLSGHGYAQLKGVLFGIFNLILSPILVFFMLLYKQHCRDFIKRLFHHGERRQLLELGRKINRSLEGFILGMILDCLLVGLLIAAALALLGIEFPVLNGFFAGLASIVPFVGALVAVIPPALIGYAKSGDLWIIPKVVAIFFLINIVIEGNIIKPLVMRRTLRLNPLAVIFAVMAMGELLGFWGIVLAIPTAAVIKICTNEMRELLGDQLQVPPEKVPHDESHLPD